MWHHGEVANLNKLSSLSEEQLEHDENYQNNILWVSNCDQPFITWKKTCEENVYPWIPQRYITVLYKYQ